MTLKFSGHETFVLRSYWPKKGYDFLVNGGSFSDENALVLLGVGKNMVSSIQFWMKALGLVDAQTNELNDISHFLFSERGKDPFVEDIATVWLLHYYLVKTNFSSIYSLIFNDLRKERADFTKEQLASFLVRRSSEFGETSINSKTIEKDISVFIRLYRKVDFSTVTKNFEDEINSLMLELELLSSKMDEIFKEGTNKKEKVERFSIRGEMRENLPPEIFLFVILDNYENSLNLAFRRLEIEENSPGLVFQLTKDSLYKKLKEIESKYKRITISETAGNIVLTLPQGLNKWDILNDYYAN